MVLPAILALSLAGKVASNQPAPVLDHELFAARLETMLRAARLESFDRSAFVGGTAISARHATCEVWATEYTPYGTIADVISERARSVGELSYVYKSKVYVHPPAIDPLLSFYWWREMKRIGIDAPRSPIVAIAASRSCDLTGVLWKKMAVLYK